MFKFKVLLHINKHNEIVNSVTNVNTLINNIYKYPELNESLVLVLDLSTNEFIYIDLIKLSNHHYIDSLTIQELLDYLIDNNLIQLYISNKNHPNLNNTINTFNMGDIIDKVEYTEFTNIETGKTTDKVSITGIDDLRIQLNGMSTSNILTIFDNHFYYNYTNQTTQLVLKDIKKKLLIKFKQKIPISRFSFLDLSNIYNKQYILLSQLNVDIENNKMIIKYNDLGFNEKDILLILSGKLLNKRVYKYSKSERTITINLELLKTIYNWSDDLINKFIIGDPNSFIIFSSSIIYYEKLPVIMDQVSRGYVDTVRPLTNGEYLGYDNTNNIPINATVLESEYDPITHIVNENFDSRLLNDNSYNEDIKFYRHNIELNILDVISIEGYQMVLQDHQEPRDIVLLRLLLSGD